MKDIRSQYQQAYRADNSQYTFQRDDGTFQTYVAGENGVTEEWIAMLKKVHREERNLMRRGKSEGERSKNYSLDQIKSQRGDKTAILNRSLNDTPQPPLSELLQQGLAILSPSEREVLLRVVLMEEPQYKLAEELGVTRTVISRKLKRARRKLRFFLAQKAKYFDVSDRFSANLEKK